jgi:hypothetical protein
MHCRSSVRCQVRALGLEGCSGRALRVLWSRWSYSSVDGYLGCATQQYVATVTTPQGGRGGVIGRGQQTRCLQWASIAGVVGTKRGCCCNMLVTLSPQMTCRTLGLDWRSHLIKRAELERNEARNAGVPSQTNRNTHHELCLLDHQHLYLNLTRFSRSVTFNLLLQRLSVQRLNSTIFRGHHMCMTCAIGTQAWAEWCRRKICSPVSTSPPTRRD